MSDLILLRARFCQIFMTMNKNSINLFVTSEFCINFAEVKLHLSKIFKQA